MDKKGLLAIVLATAVLIAAQFYQAKRMNAYRAETAAYDAEMARRAEAEAKLAPLEKAPGSSAAATPAAPAAPVAPVAEEAIAKLKTKVAGYDFTNLGGGISRVDLFDHQVDTKTKADVVLNEFSAIPIGAVSEVAGEKANL